MEQGARTETSEGWGSEGAWVKTSELGVNKGRKNHLTRRGAENVRGQDFYFVSRFLL